MYRHLLLAATLGAFAMLPAPASADGHAPVHPNVVSTFDFRIILHDGPQVVHHRYSPRGYLRSQPWPPRFKHHWARPRWHQPPHHHARHFWSRDNRHHTRHFWSRDNDHRRDFKRAHRKGWVHAPVRHHDRHNGFKDRHHRR